MNTVSNPEKPKVPGLRFPEFKEEWEYHKFGKYCKSISSGTTMPDTTVGLFPIFGSRGIIGFNDNYTHSEDKILVARVGAYAGALNKVKGKYSVTDNTLIIDQKDTLSVDFTFSLLEHIDLNKLIFGSGQPLITGTQLKALRIYVPSLTEQTKIGDFLTSVDERIQGLAKKKELLEQYKKGVMKKLFSQQVRFIQNDSTPFPDWEEKELGTISLRPGNRNIDEKIVDVLTNSATDGIVNQQDYFDKDIAVQGNLGNYHIVEVDDFIYNPRISSSAPVGPFNRNNLKRGVMSPLYTVLKFTEGDLDYLEYYFATSFWHRYMHSIANFGARHDRMNVTVVDFAKMPIPFPHLDEQKKIADFLSSIDGKINAVEDQLEAAKTFKKGLLQVMFV